MGDIPDNTVDLVLTDPPYIISKKSNFDKGGWNVPNSIYSRKTPPKTDFGEWDKVPLELDTLCNEWYRVIKPHGSLITFYDMWKIQELKESLQLVGFSQFRLCRWDKDNPVPVNSKLNYLSNSSEYFITAVKGSCPTFHSEYDSGIYKMPICSGDERTVHPTQKPLLLMMQLLEKHSNENDLVLDSFMGSGTTGVACKNLNRRFIGFEKNEEFFNIAKSRYDGTYFSTGKIACSAVASEFEKFNFIEE